MPQAVTTLFQQLGGADAINAVVNEFYERVLSDPQVKGFFANTDMDLQAERQKQFITMALGGPDGYEGRNMKDAHAHLAITEHHFNLIAEHLVNTLKWAGADDSAIEGVVAAVAPLKDEVVTA